MKHIESILPENVADELTRLLLDDATISLALKDLLHRDTGCDIPSLGNIPTSDIEEIIPLCLSILRRFWNTPLTALGDGTDKKSLADTFKRLINNRVQGNEALGIHAANANIASAIAALTKRHIDDGLTLTLPADGSASLPDGLSLAQLLCSGLENSITEIRDNNRGWVYAKQFPWSSYPNIKRAELNCIDHTAEIISAPLEQVELPRLKHSLNDFRIINGALAEEITIPELEDFNGWLGYSSQGYGKVYNCPNLKVLRFPKIHTSAVSTVGGSQSNIVASCPNLEELYMPSFSYIYNSYIVNNCPKLRKVVFGTLMTDFVSAYGDYINNFTNGSSTNLIHFEIGADTAVSLHMNWWLPSEETLANPEFLSNFKQYIAQRLTDSGSGLTLTLSQAVRDAIQQDPEIVSIITSKGWTISPAPSV